MNEQIEETSPRGASRDGFAAVAAVLLAAALIALLVSQLV